MTERTADLPRQPERPRGRAATDESELSCRRLEGVRRRQDPLCVAMIVACHEDIEREVKRA